MLPKKHRLLAEKDFSRLFRGGRQFSSRFLSLKAVKNGLPESRIGFAIGVKIAKRAVRRNLLKRRLREIVRKHLPATTAGYDLVFIARPGAIEVPFQELDGMVRELLGRSGLLRSL